MPEPFRDDTQEIAPEMVVPYTQTEAAAETKPPSAAEASSRPKRAISEAWWAANSVNATRSTDPTSIAGKAGAALNAVTHGSTCHTLIFLKDERPEEYYAEVNRWAILLGAAAGAVRAAETPAQNKPTVPQADGTAKGCNEETVQPAPPQQRP
jgi:hypothetical protein